VYTGFWLRDLRERDDLEGPDIDGRIILKQVVWGAWTGLIWLRIWTGGGLL